MRTPSLTAIERDQLCKWLAFTENVKGSKVPEPLYKATVDGWSPATFHTLCNNKGGTVTVVYDQNSHAFGVAADIPWTSVNANKHSDGFFFQLRSSGSPALSFNGKKMHNNLLYDHVSFGPTFGPNAQDLQTLQQSSQVTNSTNNNFGVTAGQGHPHTIHGGRQFNCTDIEVYSYDSLKTVTTPVQTPTINIDVSEASRKQLLNDIFKFKIPPAAKVKTLNILLFGPPGAGKSSFLRTLDSCFQGRLSSIVDAGTATSSLTRELRKVILEPDADELEMENLPEELPISIWDTMGWAEDAYSMGELNVLLDGNLCDRFPLQSTGTPIAPSSPGYNANPTRGDAVHIALVVLPASDAMETEVSDEVRKFLRYTRARDLRTLVVLNKVDSLDPECASDLSTIYTSTKVLNMCCEASAACGVPINNVFPMKSYSNEYEPDYRVDVAALVILKAVLSAAKDMFRLWKTKDRAVASRPSKNP